MRISVFEGQGALCYKQKIKGSICNEFIGISIDLIFLRVKGG